MREPPSKQLQLRILHGRRCKILQRKRLGKSWNRYDLEEIIRQIDVLQTEMLGVDWWRRDFLWRLTMRMVDLILADKNYQIGPGSG